MFSAGGALCYNYTSNAGLYTTDDTTNGGMYESAYISFTKRTIATIAQAGLPNSQFETTSVCDSNSCFACVAPNFIDANGKCQVVCDTTQG